MNRREFLKTATMLGATLAWGGAVAAPSRSGWREIRAAFPEGVASGDPDAGSVLLWTRRPFDDVSVRAELLVEVAEDEAFKRVVATVSAPVLAESDWTCRVLVAGLQPAREYWYRFIDATGVGSRIGRTLTAPTDDDPRPVRFAFVSCQNICEGAQNAWRRMIFEDRRAAPEERLGFVLHLGDFVYEVVEYPEDNPSGKRYDRRVRYPIRYPHGIQVPGSLHVPTTVEDYRTLYRAYLHDPDIQDARARWPFVAIWDNHEFSWLGWQSLQEFGGKTFPAQTRKVAANQAWFEYQPARVTKSGGASLAAFSPPHVVDAPVTDFDAHGLGTEPNNLAALASLTGYRALRWGRHVDLIITDQRSYRSREPTARPEAKPFDGPFRDLYPEEVAMALDAGRGHAGGHPQATLTFGAVTIANFARDEPPQTILGAQQKAWFLDRLRGSQATWKIWGNSLGTPDERVDPQHLPAGFPKPWPSRGYACFGSGDWGTAWTERGELYDAVCDAGITGFAILSGDRHSFEAGLAAKALPPAEFAPVGLAFVTGSLSAVGLVEAVEHTIPKSDPLRPLYLAEPDGGPPQPVVNLLLHHGVRSALEYGRSGNLAKARALRNPDLSPHLSFVDVGGHGYATVRVDGAVFESEFVCIPRPLERSEGDDGGPIRYRVRHRARLWQHGEVPVLEQTVVEGNPELSV